MNKHPNTQSKSISPESKIEPGTLFRLEGEASIVANLNDIQNIIFNKKLISAREETQHLINSSIKRKEFLKKELEVLKSKQESEARESKSEQGLLSDFTERTKLLNEKLEEYENKNKLIQKTVKDIKDFIEVFGLDSELEKKSEAELELQKKQNSDELEIFKDRKGIPYYAILKAKELKIGNALILAKKKNKLNRLFNDILGEHHTKNLSIEVKSSMVLKEIEKIKDEISSIVPPSIKEKTDIISKEIETIDKNIDKFNKELSILDSRIIVRNNNSLKNINLLDNGSLVLDGSFQPLATKNKNAIRVSEVNINLDEDLDDKYCLLIYKKLLNKFSTESGVSISPTLKVNFLRDNNKFKSISTNLSYRNNEFVMSNLKLIRHGDLEIFAEYDSKTLLLTDHPSLSKSDIQESPKPDSETRSSNAQASSSKPEEEVDVKYDFDAIYSFYQDRMLKETDVAQTQDINALFLTEQASPAKKTKEEDLENDSETVSLTDQDSSSQLSKDESVELDSETLLLADQDISTEPTIKIDVETTKKVEDIVEKYICSEQFDKDIEKIQVEVDDSMSDTDELTNVSFADKTLSRSSSEESINTQGLTQPNSAESNNPKNGDYKSQLETVVENYLSSAYTQEKAFVMNVLDIDTLIAKLKKQKPEADFEEVKDNIENQLDYYLQVYKYAFDKFSAFQKEISRKIPSDLTPYIVKSLKDFIDQDKLEDRVSEIQFFIDMIIEKDFDQGFDSMDDCLTGLYLPSRSFCKQSFTDTAIKEQYLANNDKNTPRPK